MEAYMMNRGPPYIPTTWSLGGSPEKHIDIPTTSVLLVLYILGAAMHMAIFQINLRRKHKFFASLFIFIFCMARMTTCIIRIASVSLPTNIRLAIAAAIFVAAGVLILFLLNLVFAQRMVRSLYPRIGWHPAFTGSLYALFVVVLLSLAIVITATVQSFYTLRPRTKTIDRALQLYVGTLFAIVSFLPLPMLGLALLIPRKQAPDRFGKGRLRTQIAILALGSGLLCLGAAFRAGTSWRTPVPRTQPLPGYFSKACFYVFDFGMEILVVYLYGIMRVDLRFWTPDGAKGPGSYSAGAMQNGVKDTENGNGQNGHGKH
ncbi:hypothetical protein EJ04DRAFT_601850 [Polyplosphaeria fusca]|uniref:DUF7702 domain-containing protein n=1 Tax=Polyplosphaeria fusca TaxID=682080 RepID=A0A9P4QWD9_9PLEO|nr:hypothetical protein EJ04DRAFT_601850 [Polyplosphaeria fusca]